MCLDQGPSWRQRGWLQPANQAQDLSEQGSCDGDFGKLERDVPAMADHLGTDLDQLLPQRGQGSVLDLFRQYRLRVHTPHVLSLC